MSTTTPDLEDLLRAALSARADQVQPEHLAPPAPVVELRPRWQSPWVLLATAAVVLLILGVVFQGLDSRSQSDRLAPKPHAPRIELPTDVGRDWKADDLSSPARLDLDGDGVKEKVEFLAEPTEDFDGRTRLQTTLSTTGEEAYGIAELGTTIGTTALEPIDADDDGDQELVLYHDDLAAVGGSGHPLVFDLREGLLVQAAVEDPDLLVRGQVPVPGGTTEYYDMVRIHDYRVEDGSLWSSRSVNAFASGNMTLFRPERSLVDTWEWVLGEDDVLRPEDAGCRMVGLEAMTECEPGQADDPPVVSPVATETFGVGEEATFDEVVPFTVRIEAGDPPALVVESPGRASYAYVGTSVPDPQVNRQQPTAIFSDGASLVVTSASDPSIVQVLAQSGDTLWRLMPVGGITPGADDARTWLTRNGALVTVVPGEDDTWQAWQWVQVARDAMAAFPTGTVCFDDVDDPATARSC